MDGHMDGLAYIQEWAYIQEGAYIWNGVNVSNLMGLYSRGLIFKGLYGSLSVSLT